MKIVINFLKRKNFYILHHFYQNLHQEFRRLEHFLINNQNGATDTAYTIHEASEKNGNIGDHVKGSSDAPILIFEYADYQCPGCASINPKVNEALAAVGDKVAVVYRSFILSYHQNGDAA